MTLYQFLLALGFWQWVGVITLAWVGAIAADSISGHICRIFQRKQ